MIGAIPNPAKKFQVEKPLNEVKDAVITLPLFTHKYKLHNANPTLSQYTFSASELLSFGSYIDVTCFAIADNRTEINIEVRRKVGTFNNSHEVTTANNHLASMADSLAVSINADPAVRKQRHETAQSQKPPVKEKKSSKVGWIIAGVIVLGLIILGLLPNDKKETKPAAQDTVVQKP